MRILRLLALTLFVCHAPAMALIEVDGIANWNDLGITLPLEEGVQVNDGGVLNINAGVSVVFGELESAIQGHIDVDPGGTLNILGEQGNPVTISTNLAEPWAAIRAFEGSTLNMQWAVLDKGGQWLDEGALFIGTTNADIRNVSVINTQNRGIVLGGVGITPYLENITVTNSTFEAIVQGTADMNPVYAGGLALTGNSRDGILLFGTGSGGEQRLEGIVDWVQTQVPYFVSGWVRPGNGGVLNIGPGVEIRFVETSSAKQSLIGAEDGGMLNARGTAGQPIVFTSGLETPAPGDWSEVAFYQGGGGLLRHCQFRYGGHFSTPSIRVYSSDVTIQNILVEDSADEGIALTLPGISPTLDRVTVRNTQGWGLRQDTANMQPQLSNIRLTGNALGNGVFVNVGRGNAPITQSIRWTFCGAPYVVSGWGRIASGNTLTIDPGVIVRFTDSGAFLQSHLQPLAGASLIAEGLPGERIVFTSAQPIPAPGDWAYLRVDPGASMLLDYCTVEYGGDFQIVIESSAVEIKNSIIRNALGNGMHTDEESVPVLNRNHIESNANFGFFNANDMTLNAAREQWWGDATGPFNETANPTGQGNDVSGNVFFEPFATAPFFGPTLFAWPQSVQLAVGGDTGAVAISNTGADGLTWSASVIAGGDWLSVSTAKGTESGTVMVEADPYSGENQRSGVVRLTAPGAEKETVDILVGQAGTEGVGEPHAADRNEDDHIGLSELLRVVQFFNVGTLSCDELSEDGFTPGGADQTCEPHSSDYDTQDWSVNLAELLRLIQFFNAAGYHVNADSEDGFGPGAI